MKKVVQVQEVEGEGLVALLGQRVTLFCMNYIYCGTLAGVNNSCVLLENAGIVYETGPFGDTNWKDFQALPNNVYVQLTAIESFTVLKA